MSSDPIESATKGAVKAGLEWSEDKLKSWIQKFRDKELAFIRDKDTIETAKELRKKGEWAFFSGYVSDRRLRVLFQMGLTLRKLESQGDTDRLKALLTRIRDIHHKEGLHIAYFVQNGLFSKYVAHILETSTTAKDIKDSILYPFTNIEQIVIFIQKTDDIVQKTGEIVAKIHANSPDTFMISSCQETAMDKCAKIKDRVMKAVSSSYEIESYSSDIKEIYLLNRKYVLPDY
jgi:hypothetical protein